MYVYELSILSKDRTRPETATDMDSAQAAYYRPDLFHGIVLVEPICVPVKLKDHPFAVVKDLPLALGALKRRNIWPSRDDAVMSVLQSPFFQTWHPEVMDIWKSHALVPLPSARGTDDGPVQLATPPWAEATTFGTVDALADGWYVLPGVEVPVGFIMGNFPAMYGGEEVVRNLVWRPPLARNEQITSSGHLVSPCSRMQIKLARHRS
jgi:pimeloyl-ACP methyl ester carboxylesterase